MALKGDTAELLMSISILDQFAFHSIEIWLRYDQNRNTKAGYSISGRQAGG